LPDVVKEGELIDYETYQLYPQKVLHQQHVELALMT
jgi:hypothetical protein